jgi:large subunit ribosomal protein L29
MKAQEIREMSDDELQAKAETLKESLFRARFKLSLGQGDVVKTYRAEKKDLARILTILRQRQGAKS